MGNTKTSSCDCITAGHVSWQDVGVDALLGALDSSIGVGGKVVGWFAKVFKKTPKVLK